MGNVSETGFKPRQPYKLTCDYTYNENVELPKVEPHCNCEGCYELNGLKVSWSVKAMEANLQVTRQVKDQCVFCNSYVHWQEISKIGKYDRSKRSKK